MEPQSSGHEPKMLTLHQPAYNPEEIWTLVLTAKRLCLNQLDHWVLAQCKYCTYFYRLQNGNITFMLTGLFCFYIVYFIVKYYLVLCTWRHPCPYNQSLIRNVLLRLYEYNKVSFVLICFQLLSLIDVAFLPCLPKLGI